MKLGIITGMIVSTRKNEKLTGQKLLVTQPVKPDGTAEGEKLIAVDTVGAGVGETVLYLTGSAAGRAFINEEMPVDAAIIGIVDKISDN